MKSENALELRKSLESTLNDRQLDVLNRRFGLDDQPSETLESISKISNVTRERIRQIEARAILICRKSNLKVAFTEFLRVEKDFLLANILDGALLVWSADVRVLEKSLSGLHALTIKVLHSDLSNWLDGVFEPLFRNNEKLCWIDPDLSQDDRQHIEFSIDKLNCATMPSRRILDKIVRQEPWPLTLTNLRKQLPFLTKQRLRKLLRHELGAEFNGEIITTLGNLSQSTRLVLIFKKAGRSLSLEEIRAQHNLIFKFDISKRSIGGCISVLEEVLIVSRGTYDLYENLKLDKNAVQSIRDSCLSYLLEERDFISAKIIYRKLLKQLPENITSKLTDYMVLGICKFDKRFRIRQGLMIGLDDEHFAKFRSLTELVLDNIKKHGPLTVPQIQDHISNSRQVLSVSVLQIIQRLPNVVALDKGQYDVVERVIGDDYQINKLKFAIQIALIDGPVSVRVLMIRLQAVGFSYNNYTIVSYLRKSGYVSFDDLELRLTSADSFVVEYNKNFRELIKGTKNLANTKLLLSDVYHSGSGACLISLDYRFADPKLIRNETELTLDSDDLIADI